MSLLLLLDPFLPMLASLLHATSSSTQPGKLIFYDTIQSLETEVTNSGINTKSVFISITYHLLLIPLNDFYENPKLHRHQHFKLTCLVLTVLLIKIRVPYTVGDTKGSVIRGLLFQGILGWGSPHIWAYVVIYSLFSNLYFVFNFSATLGSFLLLLPPLQPFVLCLLL